MKKRILSLALVLLMTLALAAPACAADDGWQKIVLEDVDGYLTVTLSAAKVEEKTVTLEESLYSDLPRHEDKVKIFTLKRGSTVSVKVNEKVVDNLDDWYLGSHLEEAGVTDPKDLVGKETFIHYGSYYKKVAEDHYICVDLYPIYGGTVGDDWDEYMTYIPCLEDGSTLCLLQVETKSEDGKWDRVELVSDELTVTFSQARVEKLPFTVVEDGKASQQTVNVVFVALGCQVNVFFNPDITKVSEEDQAYYLEEFSVSSMKELIGTRCSMGGVSLSDILDGGSDPALIGVTQVRGSSLKNRAVTETWHEEYFNGSIPMMNVGSDSTDGYVPYYIIAENYDLHPAGKRFADVPADAYYAEAVAWAAEKDITTGTDPGLFSPEEPCTRAQVVTFLWRAKGCPEPKSDTSPFVDVTDKDSFYYEAVLWAAEEKIAGGTDATHFSPDEACTRGQIVTFLFRDLA